MILDAVRKMEIEDLTIVSPDVGGVERARAFAKRLGFGPSRSSDKRRTGKNETGGPERDRRRRGARRS